MPVIKTPPLLAAIRNWVNQDDSVLDSAPEKVARKAAQFMGIGDPMADVMNMLQPLASPAMGVGMMLAKRGTRPGVAVRAMETTGIPWMTAYAKLAKQYPKLLRHIDLVEERLPQGAQGVFTDYAAQRAASSPFPMRGMGPMSPGQEPVGLVGVSTDMFAPALRGRGGNYHGAANLERAAVGIPQITRTDAAINTLAHELTHVKQYLQHPEEFGGMYSAFDKLRGYDGNPFEGSANMSGYNQMLRRMYDRGAPTSHLKGQELEAAMTGVRHMFADEGDAMLRGAGMSRFPAPDQAHKLILPIQKSLRAIQQGGYELNLPFGKLISDLDFNSSIGNSRAVRGIIDQLNEATHKLGKVDNPSRIMKAVRGY